MHLAQAFTRVPANSLYFFLAVSWGMLSHCKLGCLRTLGPGLYLPLNLLSVPNINEPLLQIEQVLIKIIMSDFKF
jgi:hypothetical protein